MLLVLEFKGEIGSTRTFFSLEHIRLRSDLNEVYKSMRGMDVASLHCLFPRMEDSKTRGHRLKVRGERFKRGLGDSLFIQRIFPIWNDLPEGTHGSRYRYDFKKRFGQVYRYDVK